MKNSKVNSVSIYETGWSNDVKTAGSNRKVSLPQKLCRLKEKSTAVVDEQNENVGQFSGRSKSV